MITDIPDSLKDSVAIEVREINHVPLRKEGITDLGNAFVQRIPFNITSIVKEEALKWMKVSTK